MLGIRACVACEACVACVACMACMAYEACEACEARVVCEACEARVACEACDVCVLLLIAREDWLNNLVASHDTLLWQLSSCQKSCIAATYAHTGSGGALPIVILVWHIIGTIHWDYLLYCQYHTVPTVRLVVAARNNNN